MSDIFREVDEEIRHERYKRLWDRFGPYLIAVALLIVVGTAAYRGWVYWRETEAQASGDVFVQAVRLAEEGKFADAEARLGELSDAPGGYPSLARLRAASLQAQAGDPAAEVQVDLGAGEVRVSSRLSLEQLLQAAEALPTP